MHNLMLKINIVLKPLSYETEDLPGMQKTLKGHTAKHYAIKESSLMAKNRNQHTNCSLQFQNQHRIRNVQKG